MPQIFIFKIPIFVTHLDCVMASLHLGKEAKIGRYYCKALTIFVKINHIIDMILFKDIIYIILIEPNANIAHCCL